MHHYIYTSGIWQTLGVGGGDVFFPADEFPMIQEPTPAAGDRGEGGGEIGAEMRPTQAGRHKDIEDACN